MEALRQYLLSIIGASVITAVLIRITDGKGSYSAVVRLLTGIFLSITVIAPIAKIKIADISSYIDSFEFQTADIVSSGEQWSASQTQTIIKKQTEAYILDKAQSLGAEVCVEASVSDSNPPIPIAVEISGSVDPFTKQRLQRVIMNDLGISKENQVWN